MSGLGRRLAAIPDVLSFFVTQRIRGFEAPSEPMFDEPTLARFRELIERARLYVEFGTGGSTLVADRLNVRTVSVENDRFYAKAVRSRLSPESSVTILDVGTGLTGPWGAPLFRKATPRRLRLRRRYAAAPFEFLQGELPDLVLVDGRFRLACALETARRAALANAALTLLFDDYAKPGRQGYRRAETFFGSPERAGRSAIFRVDGTSLVRVPTERDVAEALSDHR